MKMYEICVRNCVIVALPLLLLASLIRRSIDLNFWLLLKLLNSQKKTSHFQPYIDEINRTFSFDLSKSKENLYGTFSPTPSTNHPTTLSSGPQPSLLYDCPSLPTQSALLLYDAMKMLGKKMESVKKLAKKVKVKSSKGSGQPPDYECLISDCYESPSPSSSSSSSNSSSTPTGFFAIYVGEERRRFVVPTSYLSHPLFRMLLEKAYDEFGFEQRNGLAVPCSVSTFEEVVSAVECCHGQFDLGRLVQEFA